MTKNQNMSTVSYKTSEKEEEGTDVSLDNFIVVTLFIDKTDQTTAITNNTY